MADKLQRIKEWIQAHPWAAAIIAGVVIVAAYLVYKNSNAGAGSSSSLSTSQPTLDPLSGGSSGSALADLGAGGITPATNPAKASADSSFGGGSSGLGNLASNPIMGLGLGGLPSALPISSAAAPMDYSTANLGTGAGPSLPIDTNPSPASKSLSSLANIPAPTVNQNLIQASSIRAPANLLLPTVSAGLNPTPARGAGALTPSQQVGKGRNFTGTYQGIQYVNGYPASYGGYTPSGGYQSTIATSNPNRPLTITLSAQDLVYGSNPTVTNRPSDHVLHGQ